MPSGDVKKIAKMLGDVQKLQNGKQLEKKRLEAFIIQEVNSTVSKKQTKEMTKLMKKLALSS